MAVAHSVCVCASTPQKTFDKIQCTPFGSQAPSIHSMCRSSLVGIGCTLCDTFHWNQHHIRFVQYVREAAKENLLCWIIWSKLAGFMVCRWSLRSDDLYNYLQLLSFARTPQSLFPVRFPEWITTTNGMLLIYGDEDGVWRVNRIAMT